MIRVFVTHRTHHHPASLGRSKSSCYRCFAVVRAILICGLIYLLLLFTYKTVFAVQRPHHVPQDDGPNLRDNGTFCLLEVPPERAQIPAVGFDLTEYYGFVKLKGPTQIGALVDSHCEQSCYHHPSIWRSHQYWPSLWRQGIPPRNRLLIKELLEAYSVSFQSITRSPKCSSCQASLQLVVRSSRRCLRRPLRLATRMASLEAKAMGLASDTRSRRSSLSPPRAA